MVWVAVDKDGTEKIFDVKPFRGNTQKDRDHVWGTYVGENYKKWYPKHDGRNEDTGNAYYQGHSIELPKGTINKLIGRELSWDDESVKLKELQLMKLKIIKFKDNQLNPEKLFDVVYREAHKVIYEKKLREKWFNLRKSISL